MQKMNNLAFRKLYKIIENYTRPSYIIDLHEGKPHKSVANFGAKKGDIVTLIRSGEYNGIAVQVLEDVRPLLTNYTVRKILTMLEKEDYINPLIIFGVKSLDELLCILKKWFLHATSYEGNINKKIKYDGVVDISSYVDWIKSVRSDPLPCRLKVIEVGHNDLTNDSVVPIEWIDQEFVSGTALHLAMNTLDTRIGKPPVTYAIIYTMVIKSKNDIILSIVGEKYSYLWYIELINGELCSKLCTDVKEGNFNYVKYGNVVVGFILDDLLEKKVENNGIKEVGLLVSRLQKSIRRGRYGRKVLEETIVSLNNSPNYNLPEQHFLRVSASKQLVWRLFISIMEDCRPYEKVGQELSLLDLILLVLITQRCTEYKFTPTVLDIVKVTAILAQFNDKTYDLFDWRLLQPAEKLKYNKSDYHDSICLALNNIIMMSGDDTMLRKLYSAKSKFDPLIVPKKYFDNDVVNKEIIMSSMDHHCKPCIILYYQAAQKIKLTTKQISAHIWNVSSGYNVRSGKEQKIDDVLRKIQTYLLSPPTKSIKSDKYKNVKYNTTTCEISKHTSRTAFLILFGQKYRYRNNDVILAGNDTEPAKVKSQNQWILSSDVSVLNAYGTKTINLKTLTAPTGFKWKKDSVVTTIKKGRAYIDDNEIEYFDGSCILESVMPIIKDDMELLLKEDLINLFSGNEIVFGDIIDYMVGGCGKIVNWNLTKEDIKHFNVDLIRGVYVKIFNQMNGVIMVGPVDRSGDKMANSISYLLEGKYWAVFNMFTYLYPETFQPHGLTNFTVKTNTPGYNHVIDMLKSILFHNNKIPNNKTPKIITKLWPHQIESAQKIIHSYDEGAHGKGDASDVGSGKTATGLTVAVELINNYINNNNDTNNKEKIINVIYCGILVLVPGNALIKTWKDEIAKHTTGFDVQYHESKNKITVGINTIVISTMGRMRDYPLSNHWLLVIIDECLTTQNRNALWTQEAWKQGLMSKHLLMLSATFFRAKFLGLYYMLQMLQTNLPEKKEYLDTILSEAIVSNMSKDKRKWITNINYFTLDEKHRKEYEKIEEKELSIEKKYAQLNSYLTSEHVHISLCKQLKLLINKLEGHHCLIYARSKHEADVFSEELGISIYPEKGKHVIITVTNGTYGLNDLVQYNTIIMIPPAPDKIPQIKGRIDRPGQKETTLHMEYIVISNTIEEGLLLRIDICNNFVNQYIMPMSKFYELAINKKL